MAAGAARIRVTFQVDADGLLAVSAREETSGVEASITVKPSYGLADDDIARMLQDSLGAADADMHARALREQQVEAQRLLEATQAALAADGDLLNASERAEVDALLSRVREVADATDAGLVKAAVDALALGTEDFAARRMDRSIRVALTGRRVDDVAKSA
jgi:molecular chaperone HscA